MDATSSLLWEYNKLIQGVYQQQGLTCLVGLHNERENQGRHVFTWYEDVVHKCRVKYGLGTIPHLKLFTDLSFCSTELLYFTACLFLYRPYINNPVTDGFQTGTGMLYPNYPNHYGVRYDMFTDIASQKAYNYWDRIGDLIASFFPEKLSPNNIYFATAMDIIPSEFHNSENYKWLIDFKENGYVKLNAKRKQVVHYSTTSTDFTYEHLENSGNREAMQQMQDDREALADFYKEQVNLSLEGYEKTLLLLEEISHNWATK